LCAAWFDVPPYVTMTNAPSETNSLASAERRSACPSAAGDPVRAGLVANLARPEGNVTGITTFGTEILPKQVQLLKEIVPHLKRLAFIGSVRLKGIENVGAIWGKEIGGWRAPPQFSSVVDPD